MNRTLAVALAAALCAVAQPETPAKQTPPEGGTPKPFRVPPRQSWKLDNGLQVSTVVYGRIPKAIVRAVVRAGNVNEGPNQTWLADLTADMLKEGSGSRSGAQTAEAAAAMGGSLTVSATSDQTVVNLEVLSEFAPQAVALVADVLRQPAFPESEVARLKNDLVRRVVVYRSQPQSIADELFYKALYPEHPYGRLFPTEAMVKAYTVEHVRDFYNAHFGAARTRVYVSGVFDAAAVKKAVDTAFSGWTEGKPVKVEPPKPSMSPQFLTADRPGAPQSTLRIGLPAPHPAHKDYVPLQVTNSLVGGSFSSRITSNIREEKGFTYSPYSYMVTHPGDAFWVHASDVTTASTGPALTEIVKEITRVRNEAPPAKELTGFATNMAGNFVLQNSSPGGIIGQLSFVDLHGLGDAWLNSYVQRVMSVQPADVQRIAETYLDPKKMTIVIVGDQTKIKDQIEPFRKRGVQ
jgi:zinc protease